LPTVPKDRYYLYGRMELWIDTESWIGAWNLNHPAIREGQQETECVWSTQGAWQCPENV